MDARKTKQSLFYAAMVKHFAKVSDAGDVLPAGSYPSRTPKAKNLRFQHLRRFVIFSVLPRQVGEHFFGQELAGRFGRDLWTRE